MGGVEGRGADSRASGGSQCDGGQAERAGGPAEGQGGCTPVPWTRALCVPWRCSQAGPQCPGMRQPRAGWET